MKSLCAIVNAHCEGEILREALSSVVANFEESKINHPEIELSIICILDQSDERTLWVANAFQSSWPLEIIQTSNGDLALSRNQAIQHATADAIAFLDADDLWGSAWITEVLRILKNQETSAAIVHPELNYFFGEGFSSATSHIMRHSSMESLGTLSCELVFQNIWTALSASRRETYSQYPYVTNDSELGCGFEDWNFNARTAGDGLSHLVALQTVHFIREKGRSSMKSIMSRQNQTTAPSVSFSRLVI